MLARKRCGTMPHKRTHREYGTPCYPTETLKKKKKKKLEEMSQTEKILIIIAAISLIVAVGVTVKEIWDTFKKK